MCEGAIGTIKNCRLVNSRRDGGNKRHEALHLIVGRAIALLECTTKCSAESFIGLWKFRLC